MTEHKLHVARDGEPLGVFTPAEVRELLASENLREADDYWTAGQKEWRPLSQVPAALGQPANPRLKEVQAAMVDAAVHLFDKAQLAARTAASLLRREPEKLGAAASRILEDSLPRLRQQVTARLEPLQRTADSALRDEAFLRKLFGGIYDTLPKPVHRFLSEQEFVEFCLKRREKLLG
jgi:hypothetical protein